MATVESREARRRRIVEKGSDRLALITGRVKSVSTDLDQSDPFPSDSQHEEKVTRSFSANYNFSKDIGQRSSSDSAAEPISTVLPDLQNQLLQRQSDNNRTAESSREAVLLDDKEGSSQVSSAVQTPSTEHQLKQQSHQNLFTATHISSAIAASGYIRNCCSVVAAILVLLSYIGFPILGWWISRSIICFKPLYMLLITNISIVLAHVLLEKQGSEERQTSSIPSAGDDSMDRVMKALESGLLIQKILGALFIDSSIYAVILVCGLSVAQRLGW